MTFVTHAHLLIQVFPFKKVPENNMSTQTRVDLRLQRL